MVYGDGVERYAVPSLREYALESSSRLATTFAGLCCRFMSSVRHDCSDQFRKHRARILGLNCDEARCPDTHSC
jgi:hypothetical protein